MRGPSLRAKEEGEDETYFERLEERRRKRNCAIQVRARATRTPPARTPRRCRRPRLDRSPLHDPTRVNNDDRSSPPLAASVSNTSSRR